jgi:hypothetical protein
MALLQTVVTVHGIATEGRWQEEIAPVLYPHFEPRSKKYRSYRYLGPLDLLFDPWALFAGLGVWGLCVFIWPIWDEWPIISLLAFCLVAHLLAPWRLTRTVNAFINDADSQLLSDRAHLIAHSLGSCIGMHGIANRPPSRVARQSRPNASFARRERASPKTVDLADGAVDAGPCA